MSDIKKQILARLGLAPLFFGLIFFLPAGSLKFWEAWVYMGILLLPMFFTVLYFLRKDPELLERRMRMKEKEKGQNLLVYGANLFFIAGFLLPGFDFRYQWSLIPFYLVLAADVIVLAGYLLFFLVMKENSYLSRTVEVDEGQKLITTGPYAVVRHPMYSSVVLLFFFAPIALGSWWALIPFIPLPLILMLRIRSEEKVLERDLAGYKDYRRKVRFRLIPLVW
jgi:protein-S-isoprenylcysteine O-methyltransferase Ste14